MLDSYDVDTAKVVVIPHGAKTSRHPCAATPRGAPTLLTWGLLGPGKGIESVIDVLPDLRELDRRLRTGSSARPIRVCWSAKGRPTVRPDRPGATRGVGDMVAFEANYLDGPSLRRVVAQADVVVLPYESREQATSGVLIEAVAAGIPVVATAFPHAVELLVWAPAWLSNMGTGQHCRCVAEGSRRAGVGRIDDRPVRPVAPQLRWSSVAARYRELGDSLVLATSAMVV